MSRNGNGYTVMTTPSLPPETRGEPPPKGLRDLPHNPARVMVVLGGCGVVIGGLVAAVTGPLALDMGSWLAAYLVLVCGVGQYAIGTMQMRSRCRHPSAALSWAELTCWNLGNIAVMTGTLTGAAHVLEIGAVLLLITLGIALAASLNIGPTDPQAGERTAHEPRSALLDWTYRGLLVLLLISIPIGVVLAHLPEAT